MWDTNSDFNQLYNLTCGLDFRLSDNKEYCLNSYKFIKRNLQYPGEPIINGVIKIYHYIDNYKNYNSRLSMIRYRLRYYYEDAHKKLFDRKISTFHRICPVFNQTVIDCQDDTSLHFMEDNLTPYKSINTVTNFTSIYRDFYYPETAGLRQDLLIPNQIYNWEFTLSCPENPDEMILNSCTQQTPETYNLKFFHEKPYRMLAPDELIFLNVYNITESDYTRQLIFGLDLSQFSQEYFDTFETLKSKIFRIDLHISFPDPNTTSSGLWSSWFFNFDSSMHEEIVNFLLTNNEISANQPEYMFFKIELDASDISFMTSSYQFNNKVSPVTNIPYSFDFKDVRVTLNLYSGYTSGSVNFRISHSNIGYTSFSQDKLSKNLGPPPKFYDCVCDLGFGGTKCIVPPVEQTEVSCQACYPEYLLVGKKCVPHCYCIHGEVDPNGCDNLNQEKCLPDTCDEGYEFDTTDNVCKPETGLETAECNCQLGSGTTCVKGKMRTSCQSCESDEHTFVSKGKCIRGGKYVLSIDRDVLYCTDHDSGLFAGTNCANGIAKIGCKILNTAIPQYISEITGKSFDFQTDCDSCNLGYQHSRRNG